MVRSRCLVRLVLVACAVIAGSLPASADLEDSRHSSLHARLPEVRLRKLHLVRPDLLHYPLALEVVC